MRSTGTPASSANIKGSRGSLSWWWCLILNNVDEAGKQQRRRDVSSKIFFFKFFFLVISTGGEHEVEMADDSTYWEPCPHYWPLLHFVSLSVLLTSFHLCPSLGSRAKMLASGLWSCWTSREVRPPGFTSHFFFFIFFYEIIQLWMCNFITFPLVIWFNLIFLLYGILSLEWMTFFTCRCLSFSEVYLRAKLICSFFGFCYDTGFWWI